MAHVAGEALQENNQEKILNAKSNSLLVSEHEKVGLIKKTKFEIECEDAITPEELREYMYKAIDEMWEK
jgi:hypothetical protein